MADTETPRMIVETDWWLVGAGIAAAVGSFAAAGTAVGIAVTGRRNDDLKRRTDKADVDRERRLADLDNTRLILIGVMNGAPTLTTTAAAAVNALRYHSKLIPDDDSYQRSLMGVLTTGASKGDDPVTMETVGDIIANITAEESRLRSESPS